MTANAGATCYRCVALNWVHTGSLHKCKHCRECVCDGHQKTHKCAQKLIRDTRGRMDTLEAKMDALGLKMGALEAKIDDILHLLKLLESNMPALGDG